MAVDGRATTYWASRFDESDAATLRLDFGSAETVDYISIAWAFTPKSFSVALSEDGVNFETAFSTDANIAAISRIEVGGHAVSAVKVVMKEAGSI